MHWATKPHNVLFVQRNSDIYKAFQSRSLQFKVSWI